MVRDQGQDRPSAREMATYGIIDPDYARVFTIARCVAWQEGYALVMHGSFTRDLDLIAIPWTDRATDAEHLVKRVALALDDLALLIKKSGAPSQATQKPHGRLAWTLTFKTFGDPRFVDLSVMPRLKSRHAEVDVETLLAAYEADTKALPLGAANREKGDSTYNWRMSVVRDLRDLAARLSSAPAQEGRPHV
ncbi:MAG: hypothetical protein DI527_00870 [Chelatococcus sp.]|nr:MAG: hypothetical protein DI527_00870 [Chelatococcus sp.]